MISSSKKPTKEAISKLLDSYKKGEDPVLRSFHILAFSADEMEIDLNVDYFGIKEFVCKIVRVSEDLLCVSHDGKEDYVEILSASSSSEKSALEYSLEKVMETLVQGREDFLLNEVGTPTPTTAKGSQKVFDDVDEDGMEVGFDDGELQDALTCHVNDAKAYYDSKFVTLIGQIYNVRLQIVADDLSKEMKKEYRIKSEDMWHTMSVNFAPDYLSHDVPPRVQYKPEIVTEKSGFAEQMEHILSKFVDMRWAQLRQDKTLKFGAGDLKLANYNSNTSKSDRKKAVQQLVKEKKINLAKALALYYSNMKPETADELLTECGYVQHNNYSYDKALVSDNEPNVNFILEMLTYLFLRIPTCHKFCCNCDDHIDCYDMLSTEHRKPIICTRFKCQFEYIELGVCNTIPISICPSSIHTDINENGDVVDIMISMSYSAATSSRRDIIFDPFPEMFNTSSSSKNYDAVVKALDLIPSVAQMKEHCETESDIKKFLHPNAYQILKWLLSTNRCALVRMPEKKRIKEMQTDYQYIMMMDNPEKAATFAQNRKKYGSYWAFHGSAVENFHSILRKGLVNASNTKLMTTGAAYGPGIYMARESSTSFGYSRVGSSWSKSQFVNSNTLRCIMICEVVKAPGVPTVASPYYVVKEAEHVTTRFFLFYPSTSVNVNIIADDIKCLNDFIK
ncbi:hypothetical protein FDP41_009185 [Naegleria fowleri]|uniref:Poly [ADP-ribose] polymerase n=1 Tax=Naegleria fowleri TaxID=5763 RepID=A0A6A5BBE3_NAEFO|nr:uncharacterized protein FDP41_009185 [Naegleria fowleri]KAF0972282.1 hypothetical protein FDP41_009185 [Naegleria fowleri]